MNTSRHLTHLVTLRRSVLSLVALAPITAVLAGCSNSLPSSVSSAPVLSVATGLYPLADAVQIIGGAKVAVVDVVPPGTNPFTFQPSAQKKNIIRSSGLVVEVGGGFQPGLEAAATTARSTFALRPSLGVTDGYLWLDPATMQRAVRAIANAMSAADPKAGPLFKQNAASYADEIGSTGIDFSSTLSACPGTALVVPDNAFASMAASYGLKLHVVGPNPPDVEALADQLTTTGGPVAAAIQPWADNSGVAEVAQIAGLHRIELDTLAGPPPDGWPRSSTYLNLMEKDLGDLSSALGCSNEEND